jgi:hypothetical protein
MNAGIAKYLANRYPKIIEVDKATTYGDKNKLGSFSIAKVERNLMIINCYTQYHYGRGKHFQPDALKKCLTKIRKSVYVSLNKVDMRSSMIGCGLGGYTWAQVRLIYEEYFPEMIIYVK